MPTVILSLVSSNYLREIIINNFLASHHRLHFPGQEMSSHSLNYFEFLPKRSPELDIVDCCSCPPDEEGDSLFTGGHFPPSSCCHDEFLPSFAILYSSSSSAVSLLEGASLEGASLLVETVAQTYSTSELSIGARIWSWLVTFIPFSTDRGGVGEDLIYTSHRILFCMSLQHRDWKVVQVYLPPTGQWQYYY